MKHISIFLTVLCAGMTAFAKPIPAARLLDYKEAVKVALRAHPLDCLPTLGAVYEANLDVVVDKATSGDLTSHGAQPLIVLRYGTSAEQTVASVTTSSDKLRVLALRVEVGAWSNETVNRGTLEAPAIDTTIVWKPSGIVDCK